jgi:hypothetical protein
MLRCGLARLKRRSCEADSGIRTELAMGIACCDPQLRRYDRPHGRVPDQ